MNAYYKAAQDYFLRLEGWHLYRGPREVWLWVWIMLALSWTASLAWFFWVLPGLLSKQFALVVVLEVALMLVTDAILGRKRAVLFGLSRGQKVNRPDFDVLRVKLLCECLATTPDKFFQIASEISSLIELRKQFRRPSEIEWRLIWRKIYDPDSKQRVLAVLLAGLTIITALTLRIAEPPTIFETLENQEARGFIGLLLTVTATSFLVLIGLQILGSVLWNTLIIWLAKSFSTAFSDNTALRYLTRDLLMLHCPVGINQLAQRSDEGSEALSASPPQVEMSPADSGFTPK